MRKPKYVELAQALRDVERMRSLSSSGMNALANGEVRWYARTIHDDKKFTFGVAELTRTHGGLFLVKTSMRQLDGNFDRPYVTCDYIDNVYAEYQRYPAYYFPVYAESIYKALRLRDKAMNGPESKPVIS